MTTSVIFMPGMLKALRLARVHGFLVERWDGVYQPGGLERACTKLMAQNLVEGGWLVKYGQRYEPTEQGLQAAE
jgi:hypothetical protein